MRRRLIVPFCALLLAACEDPGGVTACPDILRPSLQVEVVDSATGARRTGNARGWWITGDQTGPLERNPLASDGLLAYGPAGAYSLIIQVNGYRSWGRDDLRVEGDACGPRTLEVRAEVVANPPPGE
jgi:hypothetical protein